MKVELGNPAPLDNGRPMEGQSVTSVDLFDATYEYADDAATLAAELHEHLATQPFGQSHLPGQEAVVALHNLWQVHSAAAAPSWVESDNPDFAVLLGHYFGCPVGRPDNQE